MVTKKVMESCSESDEEQEPTGKAKAKQESPTDSKKEVSGGSKVPSTGKLKNTVAQNKQSSIMSFFQKK